MSLPPEHLNIKRKRGAESVDVLFIRDSKRARTPILFRRVEPVSPVAKTRRDEVGVASSVQSLSASRPQTPRDKPRSILKPRKFRLERPSSASIGVSTAGASRDPTHRKLAVLVENAVKKHGSLEHVSESTSRGRSALQSQPSSPRKTLIDVSKQQLKPRASAAELKWREEKWGPRTAGSRSVSRGPTPGPNDAKDLKLAKDLDAFAREQEAKTTSSSNDAQDSPRKRPLKFQPKPSAAGRRRQPVETGVGTGESDSDDSDYEYDVYERVSYSEVPMTDRKINTPSSDDMDVDIPTSDPELVGKSIGILVIGDEDEDLWATYQENEDTDDDYNEEDEDENAEDYHGNDYPEDEMESDDEYGHGAYGYRYAHSDDEHYGDESDDEGAISDDGLPPPRTIVGHQPGVLQNEFASPVQNRGLHPY